MASRALAVADCETDPFLAYRIPRPFVWGYYDGREYRCFYFREDFIAHLREQRVICYAHNGGRFDWHYLLDALEPYDDVMIINGRIAKARIGKAELRDSYNIIPVPLAAYKKDEIDYALMEADKRIVPANKALIEDYLRSDCVYLYELISKFVDFYGKQITQASAAMHQWKKMSGQPLPQTNAAFYEKLFPYYYGGRVECFEKGIINDAFAVYDINSAYPRAMLDAHPYSSEYAERQEYVCNADFYRVECESCGAFPYRPQRDLLEDDGLKSGLVFPNDGIRRVFTITKWEYLAAVEYGLCDENDVLSSITFDGHIDFREYIQHFYELRLKAKAEGDEAASLFAKLLMNSLYGKFASNPENYSNYMIVPADVIGGLKASGWNWAGMLGPWGLAEAPLTDEQKRYYNIATSASITGWVRAYLWRTMRQSKGVLYCDTDSIAVRHLGRDVVVGDALGEWKHEGNFVRAGIAGRKLYIFDGAKDWWLVKGKPIQSSKKPKDGERLIKRASKGAKLTDEQLWKVAVGETVDYVPDVPTFSPQRAPTFTPRKIKYTALRRSVARRSGLLRVARLRAVGQMVFDFDADLTLEAQGVLDLSH